MILLYSSLGRIFNDDGNAREHHWFPNLCSSSLEPVSLAFRCPARWARRLLQPVLRTVLACPPRARARWPLRGFSVSVAAFPRSRGCHFLSRPLARLLCSRTRALLFRLGHYQTTETGPSTPFPFNLRCLLRFVQTLSEGLPCLLCSRHGTSEDLPLAIDQPCSLVNLRDGELTDPSSRLICAIYWTEYVRSNSIFVFSSH